MKYNNDIVIACQYLAAGKQIIICDNEDREGEGDLAFSAKYSSPLLINSALTIARGLICVSLPSLYAKKFNIQPLPSNKKDLHATPFGSPVSLADGSSGISAEDRSQTISRLSDYSSSPDTFCTPGHIATLLAKDGGLQERDGHTEAIVDLLKIAKVDGPGVLCEILNSAGSIAKRPELECLSKNLDIPIVNIDDIIEYQNSLMSEQEVC